MTGKRVRIPGVIGALNLMVLACASAPEFTPEQVAAQEATNEHRATEFAQLLHRHVAGAKQQIAQLEAAEEAGRDALQAKNYPLAFEHYVDAVNFSSSSTPRDWRLSKEDENTRSAYSLGADERKYHYLIEPDETAYFEVLKALEEAKAREFSLRKILVTTTNHLKPVPSIPELARKHVVRAKAQLSTSGIAAAAEEMDLALRVAPWWREAYRGAGVIYENAKRYQDAMNSFELYLLAEPRSQDTDQIQNKIYELEVLQEHYEQIQSMAGRWREVSTGTPYTLRLDGDHVIFGNNQGLIIEGTLEEDHIEGTVSIPPRSGEGKYAVCMSPKVTRELLTSSVSPDKHRISVSFTYPQYLLYVNETFVSLDCRAVVFDHNETKEINIELEESTGQSG